MFFVTDKIDKWNDDFRQDENLQHSSHRFFISQPMFCGQFLIDIQKRISYNHLRKKHVLEKNLLHLKSKCAKETEQ